ncbi:MAG: GreA/GreB family elongation factor [Clostridia bacterium]|nr:GreA/GreB family elongation factor [Clostridia bacterium]
MSDCILSERACRNLEKQLYAFEDIKSSFFDEYFPEPSVERSQCEDLIKDYMIRLGTLVKGAAKSRNADNQLPFVTIGSMVEVFDLDFQETYEFRVIIPSKEAYRISERDGISNVSCFSPTGKALLLKREGETIEVEAPGGTFCYKITSIKLTDGG